MEERTDTLRQDHRSDFVRRLFAIAVSVGFAGAVANSAWVGAGRLPNSAELPPLACLLVALVLVIGSWESYHKHLEKTDRSLVVFYTDVAIVFLYLLALLLSVSPNIFLWVVGGLFGFYVLWNLEVLFLFKEQGARRRLLISALWCACFLILSKSAQTLPTSPYWAAYSVLVGAICFRWNWFYTPLRTGLAVIIAWLPYGLPFVGWR